ncbi:MAG TPA: hypothetical protein VK163_01180 [Opitutaceae bacterium]|nr:hypothetical protein [Opitutaceae bacterium]
MPRTAAECAGLRREPTVSPKDFADAAGIAVKTVYRRLSLYRENPSARGALPHLVKLGPPWRIPLAAARALLGQDEIGTC